MTPGFFITGTNTGVGKTFVGAMIAKQLVAEEHRVGVYKSVESGCRREGPSADSTLIAADAQTLWDAAGRPGDLAQVCPQRFEAALAPPQAAELEGQRVDAPLLRSGIAYWRETSDIILAEGAGGLMSPLSDEDYNADLAADLGLPLLIVAANELGVINATLQTILAARSVAPKLPIAGVILNQTAELPDDESISRNAEQLRKHCDVPLLATVALGHKEFANAPNWFELAHQLTAS